MKTDTHTALSAGALVLFALILAALVFVPIPTANDNALNLALGALIGFVSSVFGYYFGSSKSSLAKDTTIDTLANAAADAATGGEK